MAAVEMVEFWRGGLKESVHRGHAVVWDRGGMVAGWGDPAAVIFPRSSCKMIQALPLVESGAADAAGLGSRQLALACASHNGAALHVGAVGDWLHGLGLTEPDLRCGAHMPQDPAEHRRLLCSDQPPCQLHNNCSGKHAGFLTWNRHHRGDPDYHLPEHPLQQAIATATAELCGETLAGFGIDGCSAPNFAVSVAGLARAMAGFAAPGQGVRGQAQRRLAQAMLAHPELVAGEGRACTELMRAMDGRVAVKTGAEAVFVAIAPERGLGIALKIEDGGTRGSEAAITALLVHYGLLDPAHPVVGKYLHRPLRNWRGIDVAERRLAPSFLG